MPRQLKDAKLQSREARSRLPVAVKPHYRLIEPGLHLGYRRLTAGPGTWVVRRRVGEKYRVENLRGADGRLLIADDHSAADGVTVLTFAQAQERAKLERPAGSKQNGPYAVGDAMSDYIAEREASRKPTADAIAHNRAFIDPELGRLECAKLTAPRLRKWLSDLAEAKPRVRTRKGEIQKFREINDGDEQASRRRKATANRIFTTLRAALNRAWRDEKIESDSAWRRVAPFEDVESARLRYLTIVEAKRLINATPPDFRNIVRAALMTGARYGQLARLVASDFNPDRGTVMLRSRKGKGKEKTFHAVLSSEGVAFFGERCAGLAPADLMFPKANGQPWRKSHQKRLMADACKAAKIEPPVGFHQLRHTWASHAVMNGVPALVVAGNLGHSGTAMVEKHYGHLAPSFVADAIRQGAPRFGFKPNNVRAIG